jgi:hypothetical protein
MEEFHQVEVAVVLLAQVKTAYPQTSTAEAQGL